MSNIQETTQGIQAQLAEKMIGIFGSISEERQKYYQQHPKNIPKSANIKGIISSWGNKNAVISGAISLIPGPWGMAAAILEVAVVLRNQVCLIYDIGVAYGKSDVLTKEVLAGVFASALGVGGIGLLSMHGSKVLVRRASLQVFQKIIALLAGKVTQKLLKSMISKWLPVVGAAAMAAWSKYTTNMVGKTANEILSKTIEFQDEEVHDEDIPQAEVVEVIEQESINIPASEVQVTSPGAPDSTKILTILKLHCLINLMKADRKLASEEIEYIEQLIQHAALDDVTANDLRTKIALSEKTPIDYQVFINNPDESLGLMIDLVALAKRDQEFHITEKMYIKQIGKILGYAETDVVAMMEG